MIDRPVAVITASGKGMGAACARRLARDGYALALLSPSERVETLARELDAVAVRGSVTETDDLAQLVDAALDRYGRIDAAVCNTGHPPKGDLLEISDEDWHLALDLVLLNVIRTARLVVPHMQGRGGAIVSISTFGAIEPSLAFPASSALRAALGGFTKLFADRFASEGIRMNAVLPGFVDSYPASDEVIASIPTKRQGTVDEIASVVGWLLSADASYVTGQSIRVDGGLTRSV